MNNQTASRLWNTRGGNRLLAGGILIAGLLAAGGISLSGIRLAGLLPPCLFRQITGLHCPGCGGTRMVESLLHGDVAAAWSYNPLLLTAGVGLAAGLLWFFLRTFRREWTPLRPAADSRWWLTVPLLILLFWVVRNLPFYRAMFY